MNEDGLMDVFDLMKRFSQDRADYVNVEPYKWEHAGLKCFIFAGGFGCLCGYVEVPRHNVAYAAHYTSKVLDDIKVHGGITYSDTGRDNNGEWWIGFDTMHYSDTPETWPIEKVIEETNKLAEQVANLPNI